MSRTAALWNQEIQDAICAFIRAGGYPHVAAEAAGISRQDFDTWMELGTTRGIGRTKRKARHPYKGFRLAVHQAQAQARLNAEIQAMKDDPIAWLKSGPGKETPGAPGWTTAAKPTPRNNSQVNILLAPEMQSLFTSILAILSPYPEARAALARALQGRRDSVDAPPLLPPPTPG